MVGAVSGDATVGIFYTHYQHFHLDRKGRLYHFPLGLRQ